MELIEQFVAASRSKVRFETSKGLLTVEDLWDLPLQKGKVNLDDLAIDLSRQLKERETPSFVNKTQSTNRDLQLKLDLVVYVIEQRLKEQEEAEQKEARRTKKNQILEIIARKENKDLEEKSLDDLKALLSSL